MYYTPTMGIASSGPKHSIFKTDNTHLPYEPRSATKGTFVSGGGLEILCVNRLFGLRNHKKVVLSVIKQQIRKLSV